MSDDKGKAVAKSMVRGKESGFSFGAKLAKEGLNLIVPGSGLAFEAVKALVKHGKQYYEDRTASRIEDFHRKLLAGAPEAIQQISDQDFSVEDYVLLLSHAVQDEEEEKVEIYAKLFKALQKESLPAPFKLHILKSSRQLVRSDFDLMREIHLAATLRFKDEGDRERQVAERTVSSEPMKNLSLQNLVRLGYLYEKNRDASPQPTELLKTVVHAIYEDDELRPEAIGKEVWIGQIFLASFNFAAYSGLLSRTTHYLEKHNIRTVMAEPKGHGGIALGMSSLFVVFLDEGSQAKGEEYLKENYTYHTKTVKVYLPGSSRMAITEGRTFTFEEINEESIKAFADYLHQEFQSSMH